MAPVKAPFSWPNSSLSSSVSGSAAQLITTIGLSARAAGPMQGLGHELLAGAALALDQNRLVRRPGTLDQSEDLLHRRRLADDLRRRLWLRLSTALSCLFSLRS